MSETLDILLVNLPPWAQENPHIGIGYLSAYLRNRGVSFKVFDLNKSFFINHSDFKMLWHVENKNFWSDKNTFPLILEVFKKDIEQALKEVVDLRPSIVGFSVVDPKERLTVEFVKRIKEKLPNVKIILGGPATSTEEQRQFFLDSVSKFIDVFVVGEGEEACLEIVKRIKEDSQLIDIPGIVIKNNGKWVCAAAEPISPLEKIPFPTYEEFDMGLYGKSLLVEWSRGCYSRCSFCKNWRLFPFYRAKPPWWVLEELKYHNEVYGIDEFTVVDSILNGAPQQLYEICSLITKNNLKIRWSGQIAPRKDMDYEFFKHMRKAGCEKLQIGVESASDRVLKNMRKTYTAQMSEVTIRDAKKAGIETEIFIIVGYPGEDKKGFKKTYNFIKKNEKYIDTIKSINTLHLIAGTEVYEKAYSKFNMKKLPEENWHYLWQTYDGNTYNVRKKRAEKLLDLACNLGIKVIETNIREGKESIFEVIKDKKDLEERLTILKESINNLQELPQRRKVVRKRRSIFKWLILFSVSLYTFFYIAYFWIYMILRNKVLLGGRKK